MGRRVRLALQHRGMAPAPSFLRLPWEQHQLRVHDDLLGPAGAS